MVCDNNVTTKMKTPIFQTAIQRTSIYCCETSPVSARDEQRMATTYVRMVCWAIGVLLFESLQDSRPRLGAGSSSGLNSSRSSWVHGCGRMGQTSRCFIVCSSPHSHVVCPSSLNPHFCIRDLHRPVPVRRRFRLDLHGPCLTRTWG